MRKVKYNLRDLRKGKKETESSCQQRHRTFDSLGNNLIAMLWMMHLSLAALPEGDNLEQAKKYLQDALQAGKCAKDLMRLILNSEKPKTFSTKGFRAQPVSKIGTEGQ
jgi:hypothetical protein